MYENVCNSTVEQVSPVSQIISEFTNVLADRFNPADQNDIIKAISNVIRDNRQRKIEELNKEAAYLSESLKGL